MYVDDHDPLHLHVIYEGDETMVNITNGHITRALLRRALKLVSEWFDRHQEELMENVFFLKATSAEYVHDYILKLTFNNGETRLVDFTPLLQKKGLPQAARHGLFPLLYS